MSRRFNGRPSSQRRGAYAGVALVALVVVVAALLTVAASSALRNRDSGGGASPDKSHPPSAEVALTQLGTLKVQPASSMAGYSRDQFGPAWQDVDHNGCDTRDDVLRRDLSSVAFRSGSRCVITDGTLTDPYTGKTIVFRRGVGTSEAVQIDHLVALGNAWQTGAATWSADQRLHFANDPLELLAVDGPTNEAKGDRDAATWLPPNPSFRCSYAALQIAVKVKYSLWVTQAEHDALSSTLATCAPTGS